MPTWGRFRRLVDDPLETTRAPPSSRVEPLDLGELVGNVVKRS